MLARACVLARTRFSEGSNGAGRCRRYGSFFAFAASAAAACGLRYAVHTHTHMRTHTRARARTFVEYTCACEWNRES